MLNNKDISIGSVNLLKQYHKKCTVLKNAYNMQESYWRSLYKKLQYPIVILSGIAAVTSLLKLNQYIAAGTSFLNLILAGFIQTINPKDKELKCNQVKIEYNELSQNINQFLIENDKTKEEYKQYSQQVLSLIEVWDSLAPPVSNSYLNKADKEYTITQTRNLSYGTTKDQSKKIMLEV